MNQNTLPKDIPAPLTMILGVGNLLFSDEGLGIHMLSYISERYQFPAEVMLEDGGVLGIRLLGMISRPDRLIVLDAVRNGGPPGTLYRFAGDEIPQRVRAKNSLHQVDLLEALTLCQAFEKVPETVILGVEPLDIQTLAPELTETVRRRMPQLLEMLLQELDRLDVPYTPVTGDHHVPSHSR